MSSYAYYRLPYADRYTLVVQEEGGPRRLDSCTRLDGLGGFVLSPFAVTAGCPLLLIRPDRVEERPVPADCAAKRAAVVSVGGDRKAYAADFARCHERLLSGEYSKIVLARSADVVTDAAEEPAELFFRACRMYPRMFVVLVHTPQSGTWMAATPEILLEGGGENWHTIALAGTMKLGREQMDYDCPPSFSADDSASGIYWSTKNIQEQRYVATYIAESLMPFADKCAEEGPRTVRAGNLVHLRSDFTFTLPQGAHLGYVLAALHPTPAVCGLPKTVTYRDIVENEHTDRRYYSGFMGPLGIGGTTRLYVSLRCMQILDGRHYRLYAGGGLLKDSTEEQEWRETEAKMETMMRLFDCAAE